MRFLRDVFRRTRSKSQIIGLDIGCATIKCVVLKVITAGIAYELKHYSINAIPPESVKNNQIKASSRLAMCLKELLAKAAISSAYCVVALPDLLVISKWFRIDSSATEKLSLAVSLAVEDHIPCPLDDIYFDYQVCSMQEDEKYLNVRVVACRKKHVDARLEVIQQANLIPLAVEMNSQAIERAFTYSYPEATATPFLLMDIGITQLTILFLGENKKISSFSESIANTDKEYLLQQVQRCIHTIFLSYPYILFSKLFFIGTNRPLLKFLVNKLDGLYGLKAKLIASQRSFSAVNALHKEFISQFPALFLSFGLALRGFITVS